MDTVIYKPSGRPLPEPLSNSHEWQDLNEVQKQNFVARLNYIEEIYAKSEKWFEFHEGFDDQADFIDEVEQDLFINLCPGSENRSVSTWLVHSSWTFGSSAREMMDSLPRNCVDALSLKGVRFGSGEPEFLNWLETQIKCLHDLLDGFYDSDNIAKSIGHLIGIDISLTALLLGISKQRLNVNFFN